MLKFPVPLMAIQVEVKKHPNENANNVLRRFIKRVRSAGFTRTVRANRYASRKPSKHVRKQSALVRIQKTAEYNRLAKLGKAPE
jgi:ribosomal protein S21